MLCDIAQYATYLLTTFGAISDDQLIGFPVGSSNSNGDVESSLSYLDILATFRENVRTHARTHKATNILTECDLLRDEILPNVGVRLEDKEGNLFLKLKKTYFCSIFIVIFKSHIIHVVSSF